MNKVVKYLIAYSMYIYYYYEQIKYKIFKK